LLRGKLTYEGVKNMSSIELLIIAVGLSMDAFAVAICKGLSMKKMSYRNAVLTGCFFGGFQALMPLWVIFWEHSLKII